MQQGWVIPKNFIGRQSSGFGSLKMDLLVHGKKFASLKQTWTGKIKLSDEKGRLIAIAKIQTSMCRYFYRIRTPQGQAIGTLQYSIEFMSTVAKCRINDLKGFDKVYTVQCHKTSLDMRVTDAFQNLVYNQSSSGSCLCPQLLWVARVHSPMDSRIAAMIPMMLRVIQANQRSG